MRRSAFTIVEILVVISIVAILMSLILPSLKQAREVAQTAICKSRIRTMYLAIESYRLDNKDWYPVSSLTVDTYWPGDYTFMPQIDPYLGIITKNGVPQVAHLGIKSSPRTNFTMCPSSTFQPNMTLTEARLHAFDAANNRFCNYWINARFGVDGTSAASAPTKTPPGRPSTTILMGELATLLAGRFGASSTGIAPVRYYHPLESTHYLMADGQIRQTTADTTALLNAQGMYLVNGP